jgi:hypothetical protein
MATTLYPWSVLPRPWHRVRHEYLLTHLSLSSDFDIVLIVANHLTRMAHFLPCTEIVTAHGTANCFYMESKYYMDFPECNVMTATRISSLAASGRHFVHTPRNAAQHVFQPTPGDGWTYEGRQEHVSATSTLLLLLRWLKLDKLVALRIICV